MFSLGCQDLQEHRKCFSIRLQNFGIILIVLSFIYQLKIQLLMQEQSFFKKCSKFKAYHIFGKKQFFGITCILIFLISLKQMNQKHNSEIPPKTDLNFKQFRSHILQDSKQKKKVVGYSVQHDLFLFDHFKKKSVRQRFEKTLQRIGPPKTSDEKRFVKSLKQSLKNSLLFPSFQERIFVNSMKNQKKQIRKKMRSLIPPKKEKSNKEKFINIGSLDYKYYPDQKKLRRNVTHENFNDFLKRMRGGKLQQYNKINFNK